MSVNPQRLAAIAIAKETTYGVSATPALLLPQASPRAADELGMLPDQSWRVAPAATFGLVVGTSAGAVGLGGPLMADGIGFPLAGILGDVAFAAGSPNVWTMALLNSGAQQPPSYQVTLNDPTGQVSYNGCRFSSVNIAYDPNQALTFQAQLAGLPGAVSALTMPAPSSEVMFAGWRSQVTIGGTLEAQAVSAQIALARPVVAKRNVNGMQAPYLQRSDLLQVSGSLVVVASTDTYRQNALAGTLTSIDVAFLAGVGAAQRGLTLHCSSVALTKVERSFGSRWIELDIGFEAIANVTDVGASGGYSPIKATLRNAVASGTYA